MRHYADPLNLMISMKGGARTLKKASKSSDVLVGCSSKILPSVKLGEKIMSS